MASYHCTVKAGASAGAAAHDAYIEREGKYGNRSDLEVAESGNLPAWASSSADFWKASDRYERANAKGYQEYEVALPRELPPAARLELVRAFVQQELGERHTYSFAIHTPKAALEGGEQPHAHIMFSDRHLDGIERPMEQHFKRYNSKNPEKGGCRKGEGAMTGEERTAQLLGIRERWGTMQNEHLKRHGATARVDHRSLKDQGIERAPEQHLGPQHIEGKTPFFKAVMEARADRTLAATLNKAIADAQEELDEVKAVAASLIERAARKPEPLPKIIKNEIEPLNLDWMQDLGAPLKNATPKPTYPRPGENRDFDELMCGKLVGKWKVLVQVESDQYVQELKKKAFEDLQRQRVREQQHQDAKPLFFGRKAWDAKQRAMENKTHTLSVDYSSMTERKFPALSGDIDMVRKEAEKRAQIKDPKTAALQPHAMKVLIAKADREYGENVQKMASEVEARESGRERDDDCDLER